MGTLYRFELKKMLHQKVLWVAVLLMTVVLLGTGLADVIVGKAERSMGSRQFSGREIDDSLLKEVQEAEKEYWREKESEIKKPFTYYYEEGYAGIYTSVYVANFMLLILTAIAVCGIFADEKISGTDQIIFSSVQKEKLFAAKILAGFSMGVLLALYLFSALAGCSVCHVPFTGFRQPFCSYGDHGNGIIFVNVKHTGKTGNIFKDLALSSGGVYWFLDFYRVSADLCLWKVFQQSSGSACTLAARQCSVFRNCQSSQPGRLF